MQVFKGVPLLESESAVEDKALTIQPSSTIQKR